MTGALKPITAAFRDSTLSDQASISVHCDDDIFHNNDNNGDAADDYGDAIISFSPPLS